VLSACQQSARHNESHAPLLSASKTELYKNYDGEVIVIGRADVVAPEGVVVVMEDGTRVMIPELKEWPQRAAGKTVSVTGMLQRVPTAVLASDTGNKNRPDDRFLLKGVRWRVGRATTNPS
jgi:hypothetical protein